MMLRHESIYSRKLASFESQISHISLTSLFFSWCCIEKENRADVIQPSPPPTSYSNKLATVSTCPACDVQMHQSIIIVRLLFPPLEKMTLHPSRNSRFR